MSESSVSVEQATASERAAMLREAAVMLRGYRDDAQAANDSVRTVVERIEYEREEQTKEIALNIILK